jgi:WD40 repeat protein
MNAATAISPFVGPKPFEQGQAHLFKGREHEIQRLEALVLSRRAVLFYAASGVGKSSLINAGLIPNLPRGERGTDCELLGVVRVSGAAGASGPENVFTKSILGQLPGAAGHSSLLDYLRDKYPVREAGGSTPGSAPKLALLVVDQFEELFTTFPECWRDRHPFMKGLLDALEACAAADPVLDRPEGFLFNTVHLRIVFCLREEYIAYLEQYYDLFPELRTARFRLEPLRREQARRAIAEPTRAAGRPFSEDLIEEILGELIEAPRITTRDSRPKPKTGWASRLHGVFRRALFHVPEVGHRDQQYVVEGEYVEPVQLQVICSDIWEASPPSEKVISRNTLPKDWSVDVGLGQFYDQAIEFACRSPSPLEPTTSSSRLGSRALGLIGFKSFSPIKLRKWISRSLITAMGTRAPVLMQDAEAEIPAGVLDRLQNRYLLRLEPRFGTDWLEIAHDRLVGPITRSNARQISAFNHRRARLSLLALFALAGAALWQFAQREEVKQAREKLVNEMKTEIADEPALATLIQACARSHNLGQGSGAAAECPARDEDISQSIVTNEGLEQAMSRQPELNAYVRQPLGAVSELTRQGDAYRVLLADGKYFTANFENPADPSASDLKTLPSCGEAMGSGAAGTQSALVTCPGSELLHSLNVQSSVNAVDDGRQYAVVRQCDGDACDTKLALLADRDSGLITIHHDVEPTSAGGAVSRIAASGKTLVYALCEQSSTEHCPATLQVYELADDRKTANRIASLPGTFDIITMAASDNNVAIAYRSIDGLVKIKVYPSNYAKPRVLSLPDGSRIFDVPFKTLNSLIFDEKGRYLVASAGDGYLIQWKLNGLGSEAFVEIPWESAKPGKFQFAQTMTASESGETVLMALGMAQGGNPDDDCIRIGSFKDDEIADIAAHAKCAYAGTPGERTPAGWNIVAMDKNAAIVVAVNGFASAGKGIVLRRRGKVFEKEPLDFPPEVSAASVSENGATILVGDRSEEVYAFDEAGGSKRTYVATIDSSCVRIPGPQHRVSAISFYGKDDANFLATTQEGCLALFKKGDSGWRPQLIDTQIPDLVTASVSPNSRWAVLGSGSGRIQIWDLSHPTRPPTTFDAHLPWSSTFVWLSAGEGKEQQWMILGNSHFGPVGSWLLRDSGDLQRAPTVSVVFPPTWIENSGIVGLSAGWGSLLAATTDGRLLRSRQFGTPQAVVDRLIDRACKIAGPLVRDKAFPASTAQGDDKQFILEIMNWSRNRCKDQGPEREASG